MTFLLVFASPAIAFTWDGSGSATSFTYHICDGNFTAAEEAEIEKGGNAWDAGSNTEVRGAFVTVSRDTDRPNCSIANGVNEVYMRGDGWMGSHFCGQGAITCTANGYLPLPDTDIVFNETERWCTGTPSQCSPDPDPGEPFSIGQVFLHNMGFRIGFGLEDDVIANMNSFYPFGGEISGEKYRIHEDDSVGLKINKPGASTGVNLMLAKYSYDGDGEADEQWTAGLGSPLGHRFDLSLNAWENAHEPSDILAIIVGTGSASPLIQWRLVDPNDAECFDGQGVEYIVGTRTPTIAPNAPHAVGPNTWNFTGVLPGQYEICAYIDVDGQVPEVGPGGDNNVRSESQVDVVP